MLQVSQHKPAINVGFSTSRLICRRVDGLDAALVMFALALAKLSVALVQES